MEDKNQNLSTKIFCGAVIEEGGYKVLLSNQGKKLMTNPNPKNLVKEEVDCFFKDCKNTTKTIYGLCTIHNNRKGKKSILHSTDWIGKLIPPNYSEKDLEGDVLPHSYITEMMIIWGKNNPGKWKVLDDFVEDTLIKIVGNVPDATTLDHNIDGSTGCVKSPERMIELINSLVDKHFPYPSYHKLGIEGGTFKEKELGQIPIRVVASLLILAWACEESNRGDAWACKVSGRKSKYGNAYMPSVYYFLRRHTRATEDQARMCLK